MRTFIATELSNRAKTEVLKVIDELKKTRANVKWVRADTIHITLKFLGFIPKKKVQEIQKLLRQAVHGIEPFDISFSGTGAFPSWRDPKVLWLGIDAGKAELESLAQNIKQAVCDGYPREKDFSFKAHLTIGRVKDIKGIGTLKSAVKSLAFKPINDHISEIVLFKSELTQEKAIHTPILRITL